MSRRNPFKGGLRKEGPSSRGSQLRFATLTSGTTLYVQVKARAPLQSSDFMAKENPYAHIPQTESREAAAERLLEIYGIAIEANVNGDRETLAHSLALLKSTLDPEADLLLARRLFNLYEQAEAASEAGQPEITAEILETLRGNWVAKRRLEKLEK